MTTSSIHGGDDWEINEAIARAIYWAGKEWRVTYSRSGWTHTQSKRYARESDARAFAEKLQSGGRPDLAPIDLLFLDVRPVGHWDEAEL